MDLQNCQLVDTTHIDHQKFIFLTKRAASHGLKANKQFFAIFNKDFEEIIVRYPTAKILPCITETKLLTFKYLFKEMYWPYTHPINIKLSMKKGKKELSKLRQLRGKEYVIKNITSEDIGGK